MVLLTSHGSLVPGCGTALGDTSTVRALPTPVPVSWSVVVGGAARTPCVSGAAEAAGTSMSTARARNLVTARRRALHSPVTAGGVVALLVAAATCQDPTGPRCCQLQLAKTSSSRARISGVTRRAARQTSD